jgi:hypothetical protein
VQAVIAGITSEATMSSKRSYRRAELMHKRAAQKALAEHHDWYASVCDVDFVSREDGIREMLIDAVVRKTWIH